MNLTTSKYLDLSMAYLVQVGQDWCCLVLLDFGHSHWRKCLGTVHEPGNHGLLPCIRNVRVPITAQTELVIGQVSGANTVRLNSLSTIIYGWDVGSNCDHLARSVKSKGLAFGIICVIVFCQAFEGKNCRLSGRLGG